MKNNDINFEYIEELADYVVERVENDDELFLTVIGKFEEIKDVIKEIITICDVNFESLHIESPIMDGYNDEFALSIWMNDGILEIGCEKLKVDGRYLDPCGDEVYLFSNCSSKIISLCEDSDLYFVNIDEECDCDECCLFYNDNADVECIIGKDSDTHGFTARKSDNDGYYSFSYYTNDKLSDKDIYSMLKEFGF